MFKCIFAANIFVATFVGAAVQAELTASSASISLDGTHILVCPKGIYQGQAYRLHLDAAASVCQAAGFASLVEYAPSTAFFTSYEAVDINDVGEANAPTETNQVLAWVRCRGFDISF